MNHRGESYAHDAWSDDMANNKNKRNQAAVMTDVRKIELRDVPMPKIGDNDVGVAVESVGICGSDMHFFEGKAFHIFPDSLPFVLGHECGGTVYAVGKDVKDLVPGNRVALEPGVPCGKCSLCESGRYNLCPNVVFMATPPHDGALMRYIRHPAHKAFKLPDNVTTQEGALIEPLSVGMHAAQQGGVCVGKSVIILGGGCIGLCTLLAAKAYGATQIIVSDLFQNRLDKALELGATEVVCAGKGDSVQGMLALTGGKGADIVFETAGSGITAAQTSFLVKSGGTIVIVGNIFEDVSFSFRNLYRKEAQIKTVFRYRNTYPTAIRAVASGSIQIKSILSEQFSFAEIQQAFDKAVDDKQNCVKALINISED